MVSLADDMAEDVSELLLDDEEHAEAIVYTAKADGTPVSCLAIVDRNQDVGISVQSYTEMELRSATIYCSTEDVPNPKAGDKITARDGAEVWQVERRVYHDKYNGQTLACTLLRRDTIGGGTRIAHG